MFEAPAARPKRSFLKRALLLSLALHVAIAFVFSLNLWPPAQQYRSGEVLALARVQNVTITHRARPVVQRNIAHNATHFKKHVLIIPHIGRALPSAAPVRDEPVIARRMEASSAVVAAQTAPAAGNLAAATPAPTSALQPQLVSAALPQAHLQDSGAMPFSSAYRAILADGDAWTYLRTRLGRRFKIRLKVDEGGTATDIQILSPSPIDQSIQDEVIGRLKNTRFEPKELDGLKYADEIELKPT